MYKLTLPSLPFVTLLRKLSEEFSIEIPDEEADRITTVGEGTFFVPSPSFWAPDLARDRSFFDADRDISIPTAIEYISKTPEAH